MQKLFLAAVLLALPFAAGCSSGGSGVAPAPTPKPAQSPSEKPVSKPADKAPVLQLPQLPQRDGNESIADYAKRAGLEPTQTLDLGGGVKLELVLIPSGKFLMGSPAEPKNDGPYQFLTWVIIGDDEFPQHEVTLTKPYYMGKYVVTQEQYEKVMGANPSEFKGATNPVEQVSWEDAQHFCAKLSTASGKTVRLPTEAEWECACRAGNTARYFFGDIEADPNANPDDAPKELVEYAWDYSISKDTTHPVGHKKPNNWGLYDIQGNVNEWCQDWYGNYQKDGATDPQGSAHGTERVLRGGAYNNCHWYCRSAIRSKDFPDAAHAASSIGFRVVVDVVSKAP